ncbi:MAG TPA: formate dehydrogenase accessory sulfurtransferase FdhD [Verrucomicrobiae bacterium]|nr:formate dehydrogenase accessory sulfurtransferase FdhD [Verrucomicrobiae bacterium]
MTSQPGSAVVSTELVRYSQKEKGTRRTDRLAAEEPLELRVRGRGIAVTMRTPGNDEELAAGFLLSEGIIRKRSDIVAMRPCFQSDAPENTLNIFLAPGVKVNFKHLTRHVFASSSCGLCGKASIEAVRQQFPEIVSGLKVRVGVLEQITHSMRQAQVTFNATGGLHAAAAFEADGRLLVLREDIGRHNAVDKVIGHGLLQGKLPFASHLLLVSGRASFEIMQKALAARIPIVCSVSAPSSLAVEFARDSGQSLIGFLRERSLNVYAGTERISQ